MQVRENALSGPDIQRILEHLCARGEAAQMHFMGTEVVLQARFVEVSEELIYLGLTGPLRTTQLRQVCSVSFTHNERPFLFLTSVEDIRGQGMQAPGQGVQAPGQFVLRVPELIVGVELRRVLRVPVTGEIEGLDVRIVTDDQKAWTPRLLDLSLAGMLVEFAKEPVPDLSVYARIQVEVSMGDESVRLRGVVKRQEPRRFGVFFPEVLRGAELKPPQALRRMVKTLEARWMKEREEREEREERAERED